MRTPHGRPSRILLALLTALALPTLAQAQAQTPAPSKPATDATRAANRKVYESLPFDDTQDFADARRGFIAAPSPLTVKKPGGIVWDMESYGRFIGLDQPPPDTVNPSLWRNAQLNMQYGLFQVNERIFQVRGYDLSNITFVKGDTGWIVFDPLISAETAKAALELVTANLGSRPIHAVVYSHSHVDHFGGMRGIVDETDVRSGKVKVIAPEGFLEHAVSENVIAGNAMSRRAIYMFGALLPRGPQASVGAGLGQTTSNGTVTLIPPTDSIAKTGEERVIDGVRMVFQMTPGTEAPAEMNTWFPDWKALWMAENTTATLHNILTLRGAPVRDALVWSKYINETIALYGGEVQVKFQSHHWPVWDNGRVVDYLKKQRDLYRFVHDRTVNLMNQGYTGEEIAEMIQLPPELERFWANRGYYGTVRHNARAVYQRYMGWYDGNPSNLNNLPPVETAKKTVQYMGGEANVLKQARADFDKGEYRWIASVMRHVVFANPQNREAKELLADAYEQLGYQAESGPWRSIYLQGAYELRNGVPGGAGIQSASPDIIRAIPPDMLFDYLAVRLNSEKAAGKNLGINITFPDLKTSYGLKVENGVLNQGRPLAQPDASITMNKSTLDAIQLRQTTLEAAAKSGDVKLEGRREAFGELMGMMDTFPFWFNIVTP